MKKILSTIALLILAIPSFGQCPPCQVPNEHRYEWLYTQCMQDSLYLTYTDRSEIAFIDTNGILTTITWGALRDSLGIGLYRPSGVLYAGASGLPEDDSAYFRWNATNNTLNFGPGNGTDEINIYADSAENSKIYIEGGGSLNGIVGTTNWGTFANPMPRGTRGTLLEFSAAKWNGTAFTPTRGASMTLFSTQAPWSAAANGMGVKMYCVANNSTTSIQSLQIWADGHISTSTVSSGRDTLWEFYCDGDMVIKTTRPSFMTSDSILVLDTADEVRAWKPYREIAIKNDSNHFGALTVTTLTSTGNITSGDNFVASMGGSFTWASGRSRIYSPANGNIQLANNANNNFNMLQFGGTSSSFPAIQRQGTVLRFLTADTSGFAEVQTGTLSVNTTPVAGADLTVNSVFQLNPITATQASALTPSFGMFVVVNSTNGTFTSTGLWFYDSTAWVKIS